MNKIDLWLKSLEGCFQAAGEIAPWPTHVSIPSIYCGDLEAADLYQRVKSIFEAGDGEKILSKLQIGPSAAKALLMDLICGLKVAKPSISKAERVWFVEKVLESIKMIQAGDVFCLNKKNLILTKNEAQKIFQETPWLWVNKKFKKELAQTFYKTSSAAKSLIWSLFFYGWDDVGYEVHGPYEITDKKGKSYQMVVSDYFDLKPTLLWPEMASFPYEKVRLIGLYKKEAELSVDMFIHFISKGNLLEATEGIYLEVNGVPVRGKNEAEITTEQILQRVMSQHRQIEAMTKAEIIKKYIESRYYAFRRWRWYFGEDWQPPKKVISRIKEWGIIEIPLGKAPEWKDLKKAFDPRTNYVPGKSK